MNKFSAKNRTIILSAVWLILIGIMFSYLFGILDNSNQQIVDDTDKQKNSVAVLQAQQQSYIKAQSDLKILAGKTYQPDSFFSKDITLVYEIQTLEQWGQRLNVTMLLSGLGGTVNSAPKAPTATPIVQIPYNISLTGDFGQVEKFLKVLENLSFITNVTAVNLSAADKGQVNLNLSANFYLQK